MMQVEVIAEDADHDQEYFSDYKPDDASSSSAGDDDDKDSDFEEPAALTAEERAAAERARREKLEVRRPRPYHKRRRPTCSCSEKFCPIRLMLGTYVNPSSTK